MNGQIDTSGAKQAASSIFGTILWGFCAALGAGLGWASAHWILAHF